MALSKIRNDSLEDNAVHGRRNLVINGAMQVAQRGTSSTGLGADQETYHVIDRIKHLSGGTSAGRYTVTQESITDLAGFSKALKLACTTADTSIGAGEFFGLSYFFEGQDVQGLEKGFSTAKPVTVSFYVKGNASATYTAELKDNDNSRTNGQTFSVTTDWTRVELTYPGDTTGKLNNDNGLSFSLSLFLHGGSTYTGGTFTNGTWASEVQANRISSSNTSFYDSTSRTFFITGLQIEVGEQATPFEHRSFADEMASCQRYYVAGVFRGAGYMSSTSATFSMTMTQPMRLTGSGVSGATLTASGNGAAVSAGSSGTRRTFTISAMGLSTGTTASRLSCSFTHDYTFGSGDNAIAGGLNGTFTLDMEL